MRTKIIFAIFFLIFSACKKSKSETETPAPPPMLSQSSEGIEGQGLGIIEMHSFGDSEGLLIMHPELQDAFKQDGGSQEDSVAAVAETAGELNALMVWDELAAAESGETKGLGISAPVMKAQAFYAWTSLKKGVTALPSKILNATIRNMKSYFYKAIGRKFQEINSKIKKDLEGNDQYVRGFDVLKANPTFKVGGKDITLDNNKGQMMLGHMPDRPLVIDMQMSLAAFNIVKKENKLPKNLSEDEVLRGITDGTLDPSKLLKRKLTYSELQNQINSDTPIKEYAILKQFELDYQDKMLSGADISQGLYDEFARRNNLTPANTTAIDNWKVDLFYHGFFSKETLVRTEKTTLKTPDRSTIANEEGFSNLVKDFANALENGAITSVHCKSGQGRSATVAAGVYIELIIRKIPEEDLKKLSRKDRQKLIDDAIAEVEHPVTGRIQAKISGQQRPVLEQFLAKRVLEELKK